MGWLRRLWNSLAGSNMARDLADIRFHLDQRIEEYVRNGMTLDEARQEAQRRLGNQTVVRDLTYGAHTLRWLADFFQDTRYAVRTLRKTPTFTAAAILTLALAIGANSAIFSLVNAVILKPAPYRNADRIVVLGYTFDGRWVPRASPSKFKVWKERTRAFDDLSAARFGRADLFEGADTEQIPAAHVSAEFFKLFGAPVVEGRTFTAAEDRPDGDPVVVLSYGFWQRHFGGEGRAIGKVLVVDQVRVVVVGILDSGFDTTIFGVSPDLWLPIRLDPHTASHPPSVWAAGRLRPGVSLAAANVAFDREPRALDRRRRFGSGTGRDRHSDAAGIQSGRNSADWSAGLWCQPRLARSDFHISGLYRDGIAVRGLARQARLSNRNERYLHAGVPFVGWTAPTLGACPPADNRVGAGVDAAGRVGAAHTHVYRSPYCRSGLRNA